MESDVSDWSAGRAYFFLTSAVAPRPIAWITTQDETGLVNAAPFSWFNAVCADPPTVMVAIGYRGDEPKDTLRNIRSAKEFVVNVAHRDNLDVMVDSSGDYPPDVSEPDVVGFSTTPSKAVQPPRIAASPVHLECRLRDEVVLGQSSKTSLVLGEVVHVGVDDAVLDARGNVDCSKVPFLGRLGGSAYVAVEETFERKRPTADALPGRRGA